MALVFSALRVLLGLFFSVCGVVKLTDRISGEVHQQMKSQFVQFADVFPLKEFGYKPDPVWYLETVGWVELVAGFLLAFGPQLLQEISNFVLTVVMIDLILLLAFFESNHPPLTFEKQRDAGGRRPQTGELLSRAELLHVA